MATDESGGDAMNKRTLKIVVILAVSLILFLSGSGYVLFRLGYFQAGNEYIGILTKKAYYFEVSARWDLFVSSGKRSRTDQRQF